MLLYILAGSDFLLRRLSEPRNAEHRKDDGETNDNDDQEHEDHKYKIFN